MIGDILAVWALLVASALTAGVLLGGREVGPASGGADPPGMRVSPCEVLVPVTGASPDQKRALTALLTQDHPDYRVLLIVESENDPACAIADKLCRSHGNARRLLSGRASGCGQKNHSLIAGLRHLMPETEVVVFCDSTNIADPGWLLRFTRPLESKPDSVLTTFRDFNPMPASLGGVCQAIYAAFLLVLPRVRPSPWGGGTAMHRRTLKGLHVIEAWAKTVVDDVVLGRLLYQNHVPLIMDRTNRLDSPLRNQTVPAFLSYLERQVLFPKFVDPFLWLGPMAFHMGLTLAMIWSLIAALWLFPLGLVEPWVALSGWIFLACLFVAALALRRVNRHRIPAGKWLLSLCPCILFGALAFVRSISLREISWHGRVYRVGRKGVVREMSDMDGRTKFLEK